VIRGLALLLFGLLCHVLFAQGQPGGELDTILRRLGDVDPSVRDVAQAELSHWSERFDAEAEGILRGRLAGATAEVQARIGMQLRVLEHAAECRQLVSVFDGLGLPSCAGLDLVFYNTGRGWPDPDPATRFYAFGWVVSQSSAEVTLLEDSLRVRRHTRPLLQPRLHSEDEVSEIEPPPGETSPIHFAGWCDAVLSRAKDLRAYQEPGPLPFPAATALYAYWSFQRGDTRRAIALAELSVRLLDEETRGRYASRREQRSTPRAALLDSIAYALRARAIGDAGGGVARRELLEQWRVLASLPKHVYSEQAKERVGDYQSLLAEDERWLEPSEEALTRMEPVAQAGVWMHRLRDHANFDIDGDFLERIDSRSTSTNPARRLADLGWAALPVVIAHLDDMRPTRCLSLNRHGWEYSYLLSHADGCLQVFECVTCVRLPDPPEARPAAEAWWKENGAVGPEPYFARMLSDGDQAQQRFAAEALLRLDRDKYVPQVIDLARRDHRPLRTHLVWLLREFAGREQEAFFESVLGDPDDEAVCAAAWALWDTCSSDKGARELLRRLRAWDGKQAGAFPFRACDLATLLSRIRSVFAVESLCDLMRTAPPKARVWVILMAGQCPDPRVLDHLVALLEDPSPTHCQRVDTSPARFCDLAAEEIGEMTGCSGFDSRPVKDRWAAARVAEAQAWYASNRDRIDWEALRRRADERRANKEAGR